MSATLGQRPHKKRGRPLLGKRLVGVRLFPETVKALQKAARLEGVDRSTLCDRAIQARIAGQRKLTPVT